MKEEQQNTVRPWQKQQTIKHTDRQLNKQTNKTRHPHPQAHPHYSHHSQSHQHQHQHQNQHQHHHTLKSPAGSHWRSLDDRVTRNRRLGGLASIVLVGITSGIYSPASKRWDITPYRIHKATVQCANTMLTFYWDLGASAPSAPSACSVTGVRLPTQMSCRGDA